MSIEISEWMLKTIREENNKIALNGDWLEIERFQWVSLVSRTISYVLNGGTLLLCTDERFEWFGNYIASNINRPNINRPLIPIFLLKNIIPNVYRHNNLLIYDMLALSFKDYAFWYIGKTGNDIAKLALNKDNGFLWIFDESIQNTLHLNLADKMIDYKLIQLYKVFEKALFGVMMGDIVLE